MERKQPFVSAVIVAAGTSTRMMSDITKQRMIICGMTVLQRCVSTFDSTDLISEIVVVANESEIKLIEDDLLSIKIKKPYRVVCGGSSRQESVRCGFSAISADADYVAIHDGARCLVTAKLIESVVCSAVMHGAATLALKVTDTVKVVDGNFIKATQDRECLYLAQTPQVFRVDMYGRALSNCISDVTDDNMLVEALGERIFIVDSSRDNIKITTQDDLGYAEYVVNKRNRENG